MKRSVIMPRPFWITLIAAVLIASGIAGLVLNIFYMVKFAVLLYAPLNAFISIARLIFSALFLVVAFGLLGMDESARRHGILVLALYFAFNVFALAVDNVFGKPAAETAINAYVVIYLLFAFYLSRPKVKAVFALKPTGREQENK